MVILISILLLIFYTSTISNDFIQYQLIYDKLSASEGSIEAIINNRFEPGFVVLYYYLSSFLSGSDTFILVASIILSIKYILFTKYLNHPIAAWFLYIIIFLPVLEASQLRTAIASTVILYIILNPAFKEKFLFKAIFVSMFHYIGIIIYFLKFNTRPLLGLLVILLPGIFLDSILPLISTSVFKFDIFISTLDSGQSVNLFSSSMIMQFLISLYCAFNWRNFNEMQKRGAYLIIIGLLVYIVLSHNPGIAHRVREVSLLGIFPLLFSSKMRINYSALLLFSCVMYVCVYYLAFTVLEIIQLS